MSDDSNFSMKAGDSRTLTVSVEDVNGDPVDLTGAIVRWQVAKSINATAAISKATGGSGITITDAAGGVFQVTLAPADTDNLAGSYVHEAEIELTDGTISTVLTGMLRIERALIKAA